MKVKTAELTGTALDWAVAKACGYEFYKDAMLGGRVMEGWHLKGYFHEPNRWLPLASFAPSEVWGEGGPIIERERIELHNATDGSGEWVAHGEFQVYSYGDTPLEAAMRCFVILKLGYEVRLPEGLA